MYTRKEFFIMAGKYCSDFARKCISIPLAIEDEFKKESDSSNYESLFLEAMRLGIDPGTIDKSQLSQAVKVAKGDENQEGGDP